MVALMCLLLTGASASTLGGLRSADLTTAGYDHPCPGQATATVTDAGHIAVTLPSTDCDGLDLTITITDADSRVVAAGTAPVLTDKVTVPVPPFTPAEGMTAAATINGWGIPTTWTHTGPSTPPGPVNPGAPSVVMTDIEWTLVTNNPVQACFTAHVTTTSTTPMDWSLTIDMSRPPYNGADPRVLQLSGQDSWRYTLHRDTPEPGIVTVTGSANGGRTTVVAGQEHLVDVCAWTLPEGVQTPGAYTVTTVPASGADWTDRRACLVTTVTGNGTEPFYFGWTADVDMTPAIDHLAEAGRQLSAYAYGSNEWMLTRTPTDTGFVVTSRSPANIHDTGTFTFLTCAVSYR